MFPYIILGAGALYLAYHAYHEWSTKWVVESIRTKVRGDQYQISIEPYFRDGLIGRKPDGIQLVVQNLSDEDLKIDWTNTLYVSDDMTDGHFVFSGRSIGQQLSTPRAPDIVFPKGTLTRVLKPASRVEEYNLPPVGRYGYVSGRQVHAPALTPGKHGVRIQLNETNVETLTFNLKRVPRDEEPPTTMVNA